MHNVFVVREGKSYLHCRSVKRGEYLFPSNPKSTEDGFEPFKERYRKFIATDEIEKIYRIIDIALIDGKECEIFQSSSDNFDQPNSWIITVADDVEFLKANDIQEGVEVVDNQYGHRFYHSSRTPASEITVLRTEEDLPIDQRKDIILEPTVFIISSDKVLTIEDLFQNELFECISVAIKDWCWRGWI